MNLFDNHGRRINYLRIAVTDRCNLRCFYCMPENGIQFVDRKDLMSFEELLRTIHVFASVGISKLRITGGEPFARKNIIEFLKEASKIQNVEQIHITSNGTFDNGIIDELSSIGIKSLNLSLDSLDKDRFYQITRKNLFDKVYSNYRALLESNIDVKVNMVVMDGKNIEDIYPMLELAKKDKVSIRFIEEMPFNGTDGRGNASFWPMKKILDFIQSEYKIEKIPDPEYSTSYNYRIKGFKGSFGIIAAYTRTFCGTCNRIRITPQGDLRTCLYGDSVLNIRDLLRSGINDEDLLNHLKIVLNQRAKNGFEAEKQISRVNQSFESMASIGG